MTATVVPIETRRPSCSDSDSSAGGRSVLRSGGARRLRLASKASYRDLLFLSVRDAGLKSGGSQARSEAECILGLTT